jgi:hypothetical protein
MRLESRLYATTTLQQHRTNCIVCQGRLGYVLHATVLDSSEYGVCSGDALLCVWPA